MKAHQGKSRSARKPGQKPPAKAVSNVPETLVPQFDWHEGRPIVTWSDSRGQRQAISSLADISPAQREPDDGEVAVSFAFIDGVSIHICGIFAEP